MIVHVHEDMWGGQIEKRTTKKDSKKENRQGPGKKKGWRIVGPVPVHAGRVTLEPNMGTMGHSLSMLMGLYGVYGLTKRVTTHVPKWAPCSLFP